MRMRVRVGTTMGLFFGGGYMGIQLKVMYINRETLHGIEQVANVTIITRR